MSGSLDSLQLFCRIVELGSLRAAGEEANLDPSNVSRRLQSLEERLRARLLTRSRVRSTPTEAGSRYYREVKTLLEGLEAVEEDIAGIASEPQGLLRVAAPSVLGARHVGPWLRELRETAPRLSIDLVLSDRAPDMIEQSIDIAVRIGPLQDSSLIAIRLGTMLTAVVGAPSYLAKAGVPKTPRDLAHHDFVLHAGPLQGAKLELLGRKNRRAIVKCGSTFTVSSILGVSEAVIAGAGLNAGPLWLYASAIAKGDLVRVLPSWSPPRYPVHALLLPDRHRPGRITAALELLRAKLPQLPGVV